MPRIIVIVGATGFIGNVLAGFFLEKGDTIKGVTRGHKNTEKLKKQGIQPIIWDGHSVNGWEKHLENTDAVINLVGENIGNARWTKTKKEKILNSRLNSVNRLSKALEHTKNKPPVIIQASAVGIYGPRGNETLNENTEPGRGFLADVVNQWEAASKPLEKTGIRRVLTRFGMVIDKHGGALPRMILPFRFFAGGPMGTGRQWMSWIHIRDVVRAIDFLVDNPVCTGVFNLTAPHPVTNKEFSRALGRALHRPSFFPAPAFALKLLLGEMAESLLLTGQRIIPTRLLETGFSFNFPEIDTALKNVI